MGGAGRATPGVQHSGRRFGLFTAPPTGHRDRSEPLRRRQHALCRQRHRDQPQVGSATPDPYSPPAPPADTTAPTITFTTVAGASFEEGKVNITGTVTDASGLARVEYSIDGSTWVSLTVAAGTGQFTLGLPTLKAGEYTISVRATDAAPAANSASRDLTFKVTIPAKVTHVEQFDWNSTGGMAVIISVLALVTIAVILAIKRPPAPTEDDDDGIGSDDSEEE